ncbi:hypothetical protein C1H46_017312 [Malus baccata]|uniref:Uncharacterized protein n=1 Tax=Malus baccata TaxID=106549 RepID=A0A540MEE2_MALBA|nr:hypothetical protein C1H46_017312 [Malus baccata]
MIDRSQTKKRKGGDESITSGCTVLILYWICLKSNLVAMIKDQENMVPAIGRWDTMIHQGIRDVKVEDIEIDDPITEKVEDSSRKATEKTMTRKRKTTTAAKDVMEPDKRISGQATGKLKRDIEKLKEEKKLNKKKISDMDVEIQQLQLKNAEVSGKVNLLLNEIGILKNKLQENQTKVPEVPIDDQMESREQVSKDQMEDVQIEAETEDVEIAKQPEVIAGKDQVQVPIDVQMDSQYVEAANLEDTFANMLLQKARTLKMDKKKMPKKISGQELCYLSMTTNAYKLLDDEIREKIKEYYRKDEIVIDSNIIDVSFFIMSKNETKMGQKQNLYLPSFLFNDMEKTNSESDQQHIDRTLKRLLEENVHKVGKRDKIEALYKDFKADQTLKIEIERCLTCAT